MTTEKVLSKLSKLHAHMESAKAIGSEKEAQAFSEKLQELLLAHKLSMADIPIGDARTKEEAIIEHRAEYAGTGVPLRSKRVGWMELLARIVAQAYNCAHLISLRSNQIWFVGTETDTKIAEFAFVTLTRLARNLGTRESGMYAARLRQQGLPHQKGFRQAFLQGFCRRLQERLEESRRVVLSSSTALVIVLDRQKAALAKHMNTLSGGRAGPPPRYNDSNVSGYSRGREVANTIDLGKKGISGTATDKRQIGG